MPRDETQTRQDLIDPALHARGWEGLIRVEVTTDPTVDIVDGVGHRRLHGGRSDYLLTVPLREAAEPLPLAFLEAKREDLMPDHGLQQGLGYRIGKYHHVPFVFASNGHQFVCYEEETAETSQPRLIAEFPTPAELLARYLRARGLAASHPDIALLEQSNPPGVGKLRYYQDAAIRAALEKVLRERAKREAPRVLLSLATGAGKTRLAAALLKRLFDAGLLHRALFLCDRTELRDNGLGDFQSVFGTDAAEVGTRTPQKNARVLIATYQTLDHRNKSGPKDAAGQPLPFYLRHYPPGFFDVIVIDECHRSAWGDWFEILLAHPEAIQIGLTATPRQIRWPEPKTEDQRLAMAADKRRFADNLEYFGPPVYVYPCQQGVEDGFLAPNEIEAYHLHHEGQIEPEHVRGVRREDLAGKRLTHALTGQRARFEEVAEENRDGALESRLILPDRVKAMCDHLFGRLVATGSGDPRQKTIVFCAGDAHADGVAQRLNTLYRRWADTHGAKRLRHFAFKCMSSSKGRLLIKDFRGQETDWFLATTKELLTTGVDVPAARNIVFFRYLHSPIPFTQMVGRGTRIAEAAGKLMFRIFDYTGATALFGHDFITAPPSSPGDGEGGGTPGPPRIRATGLRSEVKGAGTFHTIAGPDGRPLRVTPREYQNRLVGELLALIPGLVAFVETWMLSDTRHDLVAALLARGLLPEKLRETADLGPAFDLFDVLASVAYGIERKTKAERIAPFLDGRETEAWIHHLPPPTLKVIRAIARQFERGGTDAVDSHEHFHTPEIKAAGGLEALKLGGEPDVLLRKMKETLFVA